jgi:hypothetical protein
MYDPMFETWVGIRTILDRLEADHREPDPWETHFVVEAIVSLGCGRANVGAIEAASLSPGDRPGARRLITDLDRTATKADLGSAFVQLPVPGGHPA